MTYRKWGIMQFLSGSNRKNNLSDQGSASDVLSNETDLSDGAVIAEQITVEAESSADLEIDVCDVKYSEELGYSEKIGTDESYLKNFIKKSDFLSLKDGFSSSVTSGNTIKTGEYEITNSQTSGIKSDGLDMTFHQNFHTSEKVGNEDISAEFTNDVSNSVSTDGTIKSSVESGKTIKAGDTETGEKVSASHSISEDSEETSLKVEHSSKVKISEDMKMKNSVSMQYSDKVSETEQGFEEEEKGEIAFQSRIEVDSENAALGKKVFAGVYNTTMEAAEASMSDALSVSSKTTYQNEENQEEAYDHYNGIGY